MATEAKTAATDYTLNELMTVLAAREINDGDVVFVGIGLPNLACNLARNTHAPNMCLIYESGAVGAAPDRVPPSIGDPALVTGSLMVASMQDIFQAMLQNGKIQVGFLGGAQIDRYGNINATAIGGDYAHPKVRLPGSGGSMEIAAWANRCYIITPHQKRRFPEKVDFITSAGFLDGSGGRSGCVRGGGPQAVVTDLGILSPDATGELTLTALHPGASVEQVRANTGWAIKIAPELALTAPPTDEELRILRTELDPEGIYLK